MHTGQTYFAVQINTWALQQTTPKTEFTPLRRKLQAELKTALNGQTDYKTEQAATAAHAKLSQELQAASAVVELTPVFGVI
jgi:hypothetical protein